MAGVKLHPCSVDDDLAVARNNMTAFWSDPVHSMKFHGVDPEHVAVQWGRRTAKMLLTNPARRRHQKAIDAATGALLGYARWTLPDVAAAEHWWPAARVQPADEQRVAKAQADFDAADWHPDSSLDPSPDPIDEAIERLGEDRYWALDIVAVDERARGRGIGRLLVESGLREADALRQDVFILAKKPALGFYPPFGFRLIEEIQRDDTGYGPGNYGAWFMVRKAEPSSVGASAVMESPIPVQSHVA